MADNLIYKIYSDKRTVFSLQEIAILVNEPDSQKLKQRVNYYVRTNKLLNPRRGIYAKDNYSLEELACKVYKPAYISMEYVLRKSGVIFQYDSRVTAISYLSRSITVDENELVFRKIKNEILFSSLGITTLSNGVSIASPARAFLDTLYLNKAYYFDNIAGVDKNEIIKILPIFRSARLTKQVQNIIEYAGHK